MNLLRITISTVTSTFLSALLGATIFGLATYVVGNPVFGWAMTIAFIGGFYCAIGGVVLGLIVGFLKCNRLVGMLVGAAIAFTYMTYSFSVGSIVESKLAAIMFFASVVGAGGLVGLITVALTSAATDHLLSKGSNVRQS